MSRSYGNKLCFIITFFVFYVALRSNTFGSVHQSIGTGAEWSILPSTAKGPVKHKSGTLLKNIMSVHDECGSQGAFKMDTAFKMVVSTSYAIKVNHAFNLF